MTQLAASDGMLTLRGALDVASVGAVWLPVMRAAEAARGKPLVLEVSEAQCDTAGAALLSAAMARHGDATLRGAAAGIAGLVAAIAAVPPAAQAAAPAPSRTNGLADATAFFGQSLVALATLRQRRRQLRAGDIARLIDAAGVQAAPLLLGVGVLIGLILTFQSILPLRRFGAELFVVNAVALSLIRELAPLLAAVLLAGRTGSAYAAELGTMAVREELAALETMGLDPMTMLVLPRLVAGAIVAPIMALLLAISGLAGMLAVLLGFGFPWHPVALQLLHAVRPGDVWSGLAKAICFGAAVAGIGCRAGLSVGDGPRAVGLAATSAVVGGIVASVALDGVFSIVFYRLGV